MLLYLCKYKYIYTYKYIFIYILGVDVRMRSLINNMSQVVSAESIHHALESYKSTLSSNQLKKVTSENIDIPSLYMINPLHFAIIKNQYNFIQLFLNLYPQGTIELTLLIELLMLNKSKNLEDANKVCLHGNICMNCIYINIYTYIHIYIYDLISG
jgi:hypothetical protein